jgi:hypothetical protein
MEYQLEIYRPGSCDSDACIKTLTAATAFLPVRSGDLINTKTWEVEWPLLRVVNVEHLISEISRGIDPSGRIMHRILLYTESVPNTVKTRLEIARESQQSRP